MGYNNREPFETPVDELMTYGLIFDVVDSTDPIKLHILKSYFKLRGEFTQSLHDYTAEELLVKFLAIQDRMKEMDGDIDKIIQMPRREDK